MSWNEQKAETTNYPTGIPFEQMRPDTGQFVLGQERLYIVHAPDDYTAAANGDIEHFGKTAQQVLASPGERLMNALLLKALAEHEQLQNIGIDRTVHTTTNQVFPDPHGHGASSQIVTVETNGTGIIGNKYTDNGRDIVFYPNRSYIYTPTGEIFLPTPVLILQSEILKHSNRGIDSFSQSLQAFRTGTDINGSVSLEQILDEAGLVGLYDLDMAYQFATSNVEFVLDALGLAASKPETTAQPDGLNGTALATHFGEFALSTGLVALGLQVNVWMGYLTKSGLQDWNHVQALTDSITPDNIAIALLTGAAITGVNNTLVKRLRKRIDDLAEPFD